MICMEGFKVAGQLPKDCLWRGLFNHFEQSIEDSDRFFSLPKSKLALFLVEFLLSK